MTDTGDLTAKQLAWVHAFLSCGNASQAYREVYSCANMAPGSVHREASLLASNPKVTQRLAHLRAEAARQATLNRSWVLSRLMEAAQVALGEKTIKLKVPKKDKETGTTEVTEVEISAHDGHVACRSLELLGKTQEVQLFVEKHEHTGAGGRPLSEELGLGPEQALLKTARWIADMLSRASDVPPASDPPHSKKTGSDLSADAEESKDTAS
jgi:hypothetical protein